MKKTSPITTLAVLTTFTILAWVVFGAYERFKKTDLSTIPAQVLAPLSPTLDSSVLDSLEKKRVFTKEEIDRYVPPTKEKLGAAPKESTGSSIIRR